MSFYLFFAPFSVSILRHSTIVPFLSILTKRVQGKNQITKNDMRPA